MEPSSIDIDARDVSPAAFGETDAGPVVWRVAEETPVAVLVNGEHFAVMMATPDDLEDFVVGFALTEGLIESAGDVLALRFADAGEGIVANLRLSPERAALAEERRRTLAGRAGCGVCGAQTLASAMPPPRRVHGRLPTLAGVRAAFDALAAHQPMKRINRTTHAAAWVSLDGEILLAREDIGRHNALDKTIGALARAGRLGGEGFVLLSSRVSVEMVQKAAAAGVACVAAVSAPSALALRVAARAGLTVMSLSPEGVIRFAPGALEGAPA